MTRVIFWLTYKIVLLCKRGFKIILEWNKIIILKGGMYVTKDYCTNNMFKLSINKLISFAYIVDSYDAFHARLGN